MSAVPSAFPRIISTQGTLVRYSCLISEAEIQDVPGRTMIVKNKLAASTYLASRGYSSKPTDEASLQNPLSPSQHLTPTPLAGRSVAATHKRGPKGRVGKGLLWFIS